MSVKMTVIPRSLRDLGSKHELTPSLPTQIVSAGGSPYDPADHRTVCQSVPNSSFLVALVCHADQNRTARPVSSHPPGAEG
jgi:hypothetical protein